MTVMIVDDEPMMRQLLARLLGDIGFGNVIAVEDGAEGLKRLETTHDLDLVVCDLEMPIINGFEFVSMLRTSRSVINPRVPVIIVTGHSEEKNVHEVVRLGIHGFLVKPVSRLALEKRVVQALKAGTIDPKNLTVRKHDHGAVEVWDFNKKK